MRKKTIMSILLSAFLVMESVVTCFAATTQEKISDARAKQQENQSSLDKTREKIEELEAEKGESESYLQELNVQLTDLKNSLEQLQRDYDAKQEELTQLQAELEAAKADEAEQYEAMKLRIQYMYENSADNYASMLFRSESVAEFLNQAENISKMAEYDRNMLQVYRETKEEIETKEQEVAQEKDEIAAVREESADKQAAVEELVQATYNQIREYQEDIQNQESAESQLLNQISAQEEAINGLLRQAKEEEAAARLAAQKAAEEKAAAEKAAAEKAAAEKAAAEKEAAENAAENSKPQNPSTSGGGSGQNSNQNNGASSGSNEEKEEETAIDTSKGKYLGRFKLTAYCTCRICCGKWAGGGTASGAAPTPGRTVAMAGVPFGTKLSINGHIYTVEDRGTAYGHVDVLMGSHAEALQFGLKYADVYQVG
ncbi:MAG: hypothetical protein KH828_00430 [Clostridiales bacterium]|nr:hypothetical protein [Clostridiales bacterium]